jgi:hypothetical protein
METNDYGTIKVTTHLVFTLASPLRPGAFVAIISYHEDAKTQQLYKAIFFSFTLQRICISERFQLSVENFFRRFSLIIFSPIHADFNLR